MQKSLSRVKKFLAPPQNLQSTQSNSISPKIIESTLRAPTLPQLLCQNQDLKQQVSRLQKQKQQLQKSVQNLSIERSFKRKYQSFQIDDSRRVNRSYNQQLDGKERESQNYHSEHSRKVEQQPERIQKISIKTQHGNINNNYLSQLEIEKEKNRKFSQKMSYLERIVEYHEKDKKQMLVIIQSLCKKLQQSTIYIRNLQKMPNPQQHQSYIKKLEHQIKIKQNKNYNLLSFEGINKETRSKDYEQQMMILNSEIQNYKIRLHQFTEIKDENYRLRDRVAGLILSNTALKQKVMFGSNAVEHLWKIKEVQLDNLNNCLKQMRSS